MENLSNNAVARLVGRLLTLMLPASMLAAVLPPVTVLADDEMAVDANHRSGREGDPLDTNDAGGGGDGDVHDTDGARGGSASLIDQVLRSTRVLLVPQYNGATVTFKLIFLSEAAAPVEAGHAK
jgi:hypothetical protein